MSNLNMNSLNRINLKQVRSEFQALTQTVHGRPLVYLDSAATTLKPKAVVDRINQFNAFEASNVHRGAHYLSDQATQNFEDARTTIQQFVGAASSDEIIFTKGTTDGINLIASSYGKNFLQEGDEVVVTELEHHANLVPWQDLCLAKNLKLKYIPCLENGDLDYENLDSIITEKTKLVAFTGCSNLLGTITDVKAIIQASQKKGAITVMDAAQLISQQAVDVQKLGVDFLVFSMHKLFGPFGFGVLYGKKLLLDQMPPYQFGGSMISEVGFQKTTYNVAPFKFEAGTPHIEGAIASKTAIDFFRQYDISDVFAHEQSLLNNLKNKLSEVLPEIHMYNHGSKHAAILSFNLKGVHHSDVGQILDQCAVAVRVGHHCVQPLLKKMNLTGTIRASFSIYNSEDDVNQLVEGLVKARKMLL